MSASELASCRELLAAHKKRDRSRGLAATRKNKNEKSR